MPPSPLERALHQGRVLVLLALLVGAVFGWVAAERELGTLQLSLTLVALGGMAWGYWSHVRLAVREAARRLAEDEAEAAHAIAQHEARVRPTPRPPASHTISDGRGFAD